MKHVAAAIVISEGKVVMTRRAAGQGFADIFSLAIVIFGANRMRCG